MTTEELVKIVIGAVGLLITGGGLKIIADSWLAKRQGDVESEKQVFDQSLSLNQGLAVRVSVLEEGLKHCQSEHANCKYEMGLVRGQLLELQRAVDKNAHRIEEAVVASQSVLSDSAILEGGRSKIVGIGVLPTEDGGKNVS